MGTNGGGFYNANSAHPFENPNPFTNLVEIYLILMIGILLPRTFGKMVGDKRQGYAIVAVMTIIGLVSVAGISYVESGQHSAAAVAAGGALEGKEVRFGIPASALFSASTTLTSTGAVNNVHDSLSPFGGGITILNMMLGKITPGGTGSGLYGIVVLAIVTVFVAGLMVGRTPEYLSKKLQAREIKLASLYILTTPALVLTASALGERDNTTGVGLGLALSRGLVEVMGGSLNPEDTPGGGLTMVINLPTWCATPTSWWNPGDCSSRSGDPLPQRN